MLSEPFDKDAHLSNLDAGVEPATIFELEPYNNTVPLKRMKPKMSYGISEVVDHSAKRLRPGIRFRPAASPPN